MRSMKWVLFSLCLIAVGAAFGQPAQIYFNYFDDGAEPAEAPLASPCWGATALPDGTPVCLFLDIDNNGPDADDPPVEVGTEEGQVNTNCFGLNGEAVFIGAGYFAALSSIDMEIVPPSNPWYYLQISANNVCYQTSTFHIMSGPQDINFQQNQWTCAAGLCPTVITPPPPATNCTASDGARCLLVVVNWTWNGNPDSIGGFTILADGEPVGNALGTARVADIPTYDEVVRQYTVVAYNQGGNAAPSNADGGSTYLMHWSDQTNNRLAQPGGVAPGTDLVLHYDTPTLPSDCPAGFWIDLWHNVNTTPVRFGRVASDSLDDTTNLHFPDQPLFQCYMVLTCSSYTYGAVFYDTTVTFNTSSLDDPRVLVPGEFKLAQNYPNPFNPSTRIEFSVPMAADVALEVYNIQGQLVRTLLDGRMGAGVHSIEWDGLSNGGTSVGAGVYLYRMVSGSFVQTNKMLLLK